MSGAESRAEVAKLARLLGVEGERLAYLEGLAPGELRRYRESVADRMFEGDAALLARAAGAARLLPARTAASLAQSALGPLVCARLTGLLDPGHAAEISEHLPTDFVALLAAELDPRRAVAVVTAMESGRVVEVAGAMAANGEYVAMGRFVNFLDDATLAGCCARLDDEEVLRIAFVSEGKGRLARLADLMGLARVRRMVRNATAMGLDDEARDLWERLSPPTRRRVARPEP